MNDLNTVKTWFVCSFVWQLVHFCHYAKPDGCDNVDVLVMLNKTFSHTPPLREGRFIR